MQLVTSSLVRQQGPLLGPLSTQMAPGLGSSVEQQDGPTVVVGCNGMLLGPPATCLCIASSCCWVFVMLLYLQQVAICSCRAPWTK